MSQTNQTVETPRAGPTPADLWNQLGNAVALVCKQDQVVWAVFGVFWAANAVLLVALFTTSDFPKPLVGALVSLVGVALSGVWFVIEYRAMSWLAFYERIVRTLENEHLFVPAAVAITSKEHTDKVKGLSVRRLMLACPFISTLLWAHSAYRFWIHV